MIQLIDDKGAVRWTGSAACFTCHFPLPPGWTVRTKEST